MTAQIGDMPCVYILASHALERFLLDSAAYTLCVKPTPKASHAIENRTMMHVGSQGYMRVLQRTVRNTEHDIQQL